MVSRLEQDCGLIAVNSRIRRASLNFRARFFLRAHRFHHTQYMLYDVESINSMRSIFGPWQAFDLPMMIDYSLLLPASRLNLNSHDDYLQSLVDSLLLCYHTQKTADGSWSIAIHIIFNDEFVSSCFVLLKSTLCISREKRWRELDNEKAKIELILIYTCQTIIRCRLG